MSLKEINLSLCMIVKNEKENLERCLKSVLGIVDEIIIVDTGSNDNTVEIAQKYTDKIYFYEWDDSFCAARNFGLDKASGRWILYMDADEELFPEDKEKLLKVIENISYEAFNVKIINQLDFGNSLQEVVHRYPRIFKNKPEYRFRGNIHEQITPSILENNPLAKIGLTEIKLKHFGYSPDPDKQKNKTARNIALLEKEITKDPDNSFNKYNLGITYSANRQYQEAKKIFHDLYQEISFKLNYTHYLIKNLANVHIQLKEYKEALEILNTGINFYPKYTDLYYLKGYSYYLMEEYKKAASYFQKCLQIGECSEDYICNIGTGSFYALYQLGLTLQKMKYYDEALNCYIRAVKANSNFHQPIHACVNCLSVMGKNMIEIKTWLNQKFKFNKPIDEVIKL